jgi:hypothetical protein
MGAMGPRVHPLRDCKRRELLPEMDVRRGSVAPLALRFLLAFLVLVPLFGSEHVWRKI